MVLLQGRIKAIKGCIIQIKSAYKKKAHITAGSFFIFK